MTMWRTALLPLSFVCSVAILAPLHTALADATIHVIATDHDGWAEGAVSLFRERTWTEGGVEKTQFERVDNFRLNDGTVTLTVPPGKYFVGVSYHETAEDGDSVFKDPRQRSDDFEIADNETLTHEFYFPKGTVHVAATDHDGWAEGRVALFRERTWTEGGVEKTEFKWVDNFSLSDGTATFVVPPGTYRFRVDYYETAEDGDSVFKDPRQRSDDFEIADDETLTHEFYFPKGTVHVAATDHDGWAEGRVTLFRERTWTEGGVEKTEFKWVDNFSLSDGTATFVVPPGKYFVGVSYYETAEDGDSVFKDPRQRSDDFEIADDETLTREFYFPKGTVHVAATDHDGWAEGAVTLFRERTWTEGGVEKTEFKWVDNFSLSDGTATFVVPPGKHYVGVSYYETAEDGDSVFKDPRQRSDDFEIADHETLTHEFYFPKGTIHVAATDHDGWAEGAVELFRERTWTEGGVEKTEFKWVDNFRLNDGTATFAVPPAKYAVRVEHYDQDSYEGSHRVELTASDQQEQTVKVDFVSGNKFVEEVRPRPGSQAGRVALARSGDQDHALARGRLRTIQEQLHAEIERLATLVHASHLENLRELHGSLQQLTVSDAAQGDSPGPPVTDLTALGLHSGLASAMDPCRSLSAICAARQGQLWCALPDQTEVQCGPVAEVPEGAGQDIVDAVLLALDAADISDVGLALNLATSTVEITKAATERDWEAARDRIVETLAGLSLSQAAGIPAAAGAPVMGLIGLMAEPELVDGQLMMRVRLPFVFVQGQPDAY